MISEFAVENALLPDVPSLTSDRHLSRSLIPHVERLSRLFNRLSDDQDDDTSAAAGLQKDGSYWKDSSNPMNLRAAYFLYFMPSNAFRVAAVWSELARLGFRWPQMPNFRAIEWGAGPATGAVGVGFAEGSGSQTGLPSAVDWALIEQDRAMLEIGGRWATRAFGSQGLDQWTTREFHRKIDWTRDLLPRTAPRFHLWLMSYFLNEADESPAALAHRLVQSWERHLEDEGLVILVEPALKLQSRRILELRKELLQHRGYQVLLPCLGHQACGALSDPEDWCHEEVLWMRPEYFKKIDRLAGLDRRSLPFSYLVVAKSTRPREELLPALAHAPTHRLVSPARKIGRDFEFYTCGADGKRRTRVRMDLVGTDGATAQPERGTVFLNADVRGEPHSSRVESFQTVV